ncbi:FAD/FMN-containing dehydrogenases [Hyphomicrobiales bacterium]|nr:FAD/FMN-containing dehydrogenases [Hyphomicrobiales bacterium]CAH1669669.1 FAD/FMN-containing dehydrogenases [Hyphomicrobiales bacterium]
MRLIDPGLAGHLAGGVTTLCHCWKLTRRDGVAMGFTDHDRDLAFAGVVFRAGTGLEAAEVTAERGFAIGGGDVSGILTGASLTEDDLASGLYDDANIELWLVNWADVTERLLLEVGSTGEVRRTEHAFAAEVRGLMHRYGEERGRVYRTTCSADLGDSHCGIDLADPTFAAEVAVTSTDGRLGFGATELGGYADDWFMAGQVRWLDGANAGMRVDVKAHRAVAGRGEVLLWQPVPRSIAVGDRLRITAGCDKRFATCRAKFANAANFRGFPHMPGNDFVVRYPLPGEAGHDGGSLFR